MKKDVPLRRLLHYSAKHRTRIIASVFCSILNKAFDIAPEILIGVAVDIVVNKNPSFLARFGFQTAMGQLEGLAILTCLIWGFESLFEYLYSLGWRNLAQTIQHELRIDAYNHIQKLSLGYFEEKSTGGLVSILNDDVNQLERFLNVGANDLIQVLTTVILIGGVFFYIAPIVALFSMVPIPIILFGAFYFQRKAQPLYADVRERAGLLSGRLATNIVGLLTIKSFAREDFELSELARQSDQYRLANKRAIRVSSAFIPIIRMAILAGFVTTLLLGGWMTLQGRLRIGSFSVLVFLTQRLLWPLTRLADTFDLYQRAMASARRVLDVLEIPTQKFPLGKPLKKESVRGEILFDRVCFGYDGRPLLFKNLSLRIPAGSTVGLVGQTGCGKSTLVKLILRFYEPSEGTISLDGKSYSDVNVQDLRRAIGFVGQDVFLFHGTIYENILYGNPTASREQVIAAARIAEAHEFIESLPQKYDTLVGERGQKLSGGQRQRLSIARAVLKDPPIIILDEATSAVDNETEAAIQRSLQKLSVGRTTIVIAHRLSTIRHAAPIYVLDQGQIVETGTNIGLIKRRGLFHQLWTVQSGLQS